MVSMENMNLLRWALEAKKKWGVKNLKQYIGEYGVLNRLGFKKVSWKITKFLTRSVRTDTELRKIS